jgi:hypothetical protein
MTYSLYFEADSDRSLELDTLAAQLGVGTEELLNEALEMLIASYRDSQAGGEPIGLLSHLHGLQHRIRIMITELQYIRFTTSSPSSMLYETGLRGDALDSVKKHYEKIFNSSERALKAAGFGSIFRDLPLEDEEGSGPIGQIAQQRGQE